jgi:hypothetical protein
MRFRLRTVLLAILAGFGIFVGAAIVAGLAWFFYFATHFHL